MASQTNTFKLSDRFVTDRWQLVILQAFVILVCAILTMLIAENFEVQKMSIAQVIIWLGITGVIIILVFLIGLFMDRRWRQLTIHLSPEGLVREVGTARQEVAWENVTRLHIRTNSRDDPVALKVVSKFKRPMVLVGVDPMIDLVRAVQSKLPVTAIFESKRGRLPGVEWNPWARAGFIGGLVLLFISSFYMVATTDEFNRVYSTNLYFTVMGALFIFHGFTDRTHPAFRDLRGLEIIGGGLMLVVGLTRLVKLGLAEHIISMIQLLAE